MRPTESFERKNITELGLDVAEQKSELAFDPQRDLTPEDRARFDDAFKEYRKNSKKLALAQLAASLRDVDPALVTLTSTDWKMIESLEGLSSRVKRQHGYNLSKLDPARIRIGPTELNSLAFDIGADRAKKDGRQLSEALMQQAQLDPSRLQVTEADWALMEQALEHARVNKTQMLSTVALAMARLDPSRVRLTADDWSLMFRELDSTRLKDNAQSLAIQAGEMAALARALIKPETGRAVDHAPLPETKTF